MLEFSLRKPELFTRAFLAVGLALIIFSTSFVKIASAAPGINREINFQGKLVNNPSGTNVSNTTYTMVFTIYDRDSGGTALWTETQTVTTADGVFRVALGSVTPFPSNFNFNWSGLYLGIKVNSDPEMTPRVQLAAVPFAFNAQQVAGLTVQDDNGNASTSGTLQIGNSKTVTFKGSSGLTFNDPGAATTINFPNTGTITLVDTATSQTLTNKAIGSGGLTFNNASKPDITTASNQNFVLFPSGSGLIGLNTSSPISSIDLRGNPVTGGTLSIASVSGATSFAALTVDNSGLGDLFTASKSGLSLFTVKNNGQLTLGAPYYLNSGLGCTLKTTSTGLVQCATDLNTYSPFAEISGPTGGVIVANNTTTDFLLGGQSTASARFRVSGNVLGAGTGPVVTISGNTSNSTLIVDNAGVGDLISASSSGARKFTVSYQGGGTPMTFLTGNSDTNGRFGRLTLWADSSILSDNLYFNGSQWTGDYVAGAGSMFITQAGTAGIYSRLAGATSVTPGLVVASNNNSNSAVGIGQATTPKAVLDVRGGFGGNAALIIDQKNAADILTASYSGTPKFTVGNSGKLTITGTTGGLTFDPTTANNSVYSGTAMPQKIITLSPEYAGAALTVFYGAGTDTSITGSMDSDVETSSANNLRSYYSWTTTVTSPLQYYTVAVRVTLPQDFGGWDTSQTYPLTIDYATSNATNTNNNVNAYIYNQSNSTTAVASSTSNASTSWASIGFTNTNLTGGSVTWGANGTPQTAMIYLRLGSLNSNIVKIGDIKLYYLSKF